jgi:hypothetical protein
MIDSTRKLWMKKTHDLFPSTHLCDRCKLAAHPPHNKNNPKCSLPEDARFGISGIEYCPEHQAMP